MFEDLKEKFEIIKENTIISDIKRFYVFAKDAADVLNFLKISPSYLFNRLDCIYAKDIKTEFELTYILNSDNYQYKLAVSCNLAYDNAQIKSVSGIYKSADWDEREIYDLFGITFINHPDLKRILLPDAFKGHPLRKDYKMEDERLRWNYE